MRGMIAWLVTGILVVAGASVARVGPDGSTHTPADCDLDGGEPHRDDQFGYSVDVAGDTIVVGVPFAGMGGTNGCGLCSPPIGMAPSPRPRS